MRNLIIGILFISMWILSACSERCDEPCFSPPRTLYFEILDKSTGGNVFTNGSFNRNEIVIVDLDNQEQVEFAFIDGTGFDMISISAIGWETEAVNYAINVGSERIFELYVDAERLKGDCCSYTIYNDLQISNAEYTHDVGWEFFKIFVEL
jgi:hypothetical protein